MAERLPLPRNHIEGFKKVFADLNYSMVGREEALRVIQYAFLTRQHVLLWGDTGEGKTYLTNQVFQRFPDRGDQNDIFRIQFTRDMPSEVLFGGYDMNALRIGRVRYNVEGSLIKANFVFGDEVFDASDSVLRTMLGALNDERTVRFGQQVFDGIPLHSGVFTSNFRRDNPATRAFLNRILFQYKVEPNSSLAHRAELDVLAESRKNRKAEPAICDYAFLQNLSDIVMGKDEQVALILPWSIVFMKDRILKLFTQNVQQAHIDVVRHNGNGAGGERPTTDVSPEQKMAIARRLGFPLNLFVDRILPVVLANTQQPVKPASTQNHPDEQEAREFSVTSSRGMQLSQVLHAAALLDNRNEVKPADLTQLRYGLYPKTEGGNILDNCYDDAVTQARNSSDLTELAQAEALLACINVIDYLVERAGKIVMPSRVASELTIRDATIDVGSIDSWLSSLVPNSTDVLELKGVVERKIQRARQIGLTPSKKLRLNSSPDLHVYDDVRW